MSFFPPYNQFPIEYLLQSWSNKWIVCLSIFCLQAQYEFLHRAIVNYADLHHLSEDPA